MSTHILEQITPFIVMEVLEKAHEMEKRGISIIHMEVGEPDFDVPSCVKEATCQAVNQGHTHYTHSLGDPDLRSAITRHYKKNYGVDLDPDQVIVTSGSSPAILLVLTALIERGEEVILSDPSYACYPNFIKFLGGKIIRVPVFADNGFQFDTSEVASLITPRTKAIMINSPMNPTGNLVDPDVMERLSKLPITIISDEIYHGLVYDDHAHSILEFTDRAFVLNGFSKLYAMTGLRLGYLIAPKEYIRGMQKLQQNLFICASSVAQRAGIAALENCDCDVEKMLAIYNQRRVFLINRLKELGFQIPVEPTGAFYVFVNARHLSSDSYHLAFDMLEKAHIGVTPGIDFGPNGEGYLRFSYANSIENLTEGMRRLEQYIINLKKQ
jgi:aspartate/methionine/tyrosine aminotransferase